MYAKMHRARDGVVFFDIDACIPCRRPTQRAATVLNVKAVAVFIQL
jgi:hypothetical protein